MLGTCDMAVLETTVLSSEGEHTSNLYLQSLSPPSSLHVLPLFQSIVDHWLELLHQITETVHRTMRGKIGER